MCKAGAATNPAVTSGRSDPTCREGSAVSSSSTKRIVSRVFQILSLVMFCGCAAKAAGTQEPAVRVSASPTSVALSGWVGWTNSMPIDESAPALAGSGGVIKPTVPYNQSQALQICATDVRLNRVQFGQVVIRASNGNTIGAGTVDGTQVQVGQSTQQADYSNNSGGDFSCGARWTSPPVGAESAYTVEFDGHSTVINGSAAGGAIYLSVR
ncbi:MAG: hypothetical protein QOE71_2149 [Pseudonocardiales bacterium]|nr:hypothetical protein [Pseudonocardiales bacterium]